MNFTDSPYERMMKQIPRPGRGDAPPHRRPAAPPRPKAKKKANTHRDIIITSNIGVPAKSQDFAGRGGATQQSGCPPQGGRSGAEFVTTRPEVQVSRELTRDERRDIRKLVVGLCANYDKEYGCLPLDCECYMLGKWWTGAYCRYFREAVLPNDPLLQASLQNETPDSLRLCAVCGREFIPKGKEVYCSAACAEAARRKRQRDYMRKRRVQR